MSGEFRSPLQGLIEPEPENWRASNPAEAYTLSIAISLKRIADCMGTPTVQTSSHRSFDGRSVDAFAEDMKAKMQFKAKQGRGGWQDKNDCTADLLSQLLREHVEKGDPVDVANFAMMLHQRGEKITKPEDVA